MPSFAPRSEPVKKKKELEYRWQVLKHSIQDGSSQEKTIMNAEKYRSARLLYYKAILHVIQEKEWQERPHTMDKGKIVREIESLQKKSVAEIIDEVIRKQ